MIVVVAGALAACGKKKNNEAFEKTKAFADQMCACKDSDCAKKVTEEMTKWSQEWAKNAKPEDNVPDPDQVKEIEAVSKQLTECTMKAHGMKK